MNRKNYQRMLEQTLMKIKAATDAGGAVPTLLLHSCCAPCSSYVLEYLSQYFEITIFYYNPNISPEEEYRNRVEEQKRLIGQLDTIYPISFMEGKYEPETFYQMARGMEELPEGGQRCYACYEMRLREAAQKAVVQKADYFTTTLSISPYKNVAWLNEIGETYAREYGISYLYSDFKKKEGYRRSIALSKEYGLYRQDYCGCSFSRQEREKIKQQKREENREI